MKPRKILMTADAIGGVWTYALEMAGGLEKHGVEVDLAIMGGCFDEDKRKEAAAYPNLNVFKSDYKLEWMPDSQKDVCKAGSWLLHLRDRLHPDVIHLNNYAHVSLPWNAPTVVVAHSCVYSWWEAVKTGVPTSEWDHYKKIVAENLITANAVVAPTKAMLGSLQRIYGSFTNGSVIANGRDPHLFFSGEKQNFLFSAGRLWDEAKNASALTQLAPELTWPICFAGNRHAPHESAQTLQGGQNSYFLGSLGTERMADWLSRASIFVSPALYEPFGLTILEAALSGCALVLSNIDSLMENWQDCAIFVDPRNHEELRRSLNKLIEDKQQRLELAQRARERALNFTATRMATQYLDLYTELLHASSRVAEGELAACA
jgi:glycogen(starch) synthase